MKLNLGCNIDIKKDFVNQDFTKYKGINVISDLNSFPYPFKDNTFTYIYACHVIEHLDDIIKVLKELHRISKSNGIIEIRVPHFANVSATAHLTHKKCFGYYTFDLFENKYEKYMDEKFKIISKHLKWTAHKNPLIKTIGKVIDFLSNLSPFLYERFWCYWVGGSCEIQFKLKIKK